MHKLKSIYLGYRLMRYKHNTSTFRVILSR